MNKNKNRQEQSALPQEASNPPPLNEDTRPTLTPSQALKIQLSPQQISEDQQSRIKVITDGCIALGEIVLANSKRSADQTAALRKLREMKFTIVASIATEEFL